MNNQPQVIFDNGKPAFIILRYEDYIMLSGRNSKAETGEDKFVPFILSNYINNPIRLARIKAGLNQQQLAELLDVTQGYVSRIESRNFKVSDKLLKQVKSTITKSQKRHKKKTG